MNDGSESTVANDNKGAEDLRGFDNGGVEGDEESSNRHDEIPQSLPTTPHSDPGRDAASGEALALDPTNPWKAPPGAGRIDGKQQARHWNFTINNYLQIEYDRIKSILQEDESLPVKTRHVVTAIVAKEVGEENGTPHLQGYIHFKNVKRRPTIFKFFGYKWARFHLAAQDMKRKPPIASFRYCMKGGDYYVVGRNPDEEARSKNDERRGGGGPDYTEVTRLIKEGKLTTMEQVSDFDAEVAARNEEYLKGMIVRYMPKPPVEKFDLRPWQVEMEEKLNGPPDKREVIFVVDRKGNAGKTWFTKYYEEKSGRGKTILVGADKRENVAYDTLNDVIEYGTPNVLFMDAPRSRSRFVSFTFLEEIKDGKVRSPKYKSKQLPLQHALHVVVMMNDLPRRNPQDEALSDDRFTYLLIDDTGEKGTWVTGRGYLDPDDYQGTAYEVIRWTVQSRLPNRLQDSLNRAYDSYLRSSSDDTSNTRDQEVRIRDLQRSFSDIVHV